MLKGIPVILSSQLFKTMMDMGHSDALILADANFPAETCAKRLIRLDGVEIPDLLEAILPFFPLDTFIDNPVRLMRNLPEEPVPGIWNRYEEILRELDFQRAFKGFHMIDRLPFYDEARSAYAIVQTATTARYANIVLQKGVL
jgi:L-fucose mutarotase